MKGKISFYFVLYLIVLVELLAVIVERDTKEQELNQRIQEYEAIQDSLIKLYKKPIVISVQDKTDWVISGRDSLGLLVSVSELQTPEEKANVNFYLKLNKKEDSTWINNAVQLNKRTGNGTFYFKERRPGLYNYKIYCTVDRDFPSYLPPIILDKIREKLGSDFKVSSDTIVFSVNAKLPAQNFDRPGRG